MALDVTDFVRITFAMVEENFENLPPKMLQNRPQSKNFGRITFTMVEENFENLPSKMH